MNASRRTRLLRATIAIYGAFALYYYYTQEHAFDPFTQVPLTRLADPIPPRAPGEVRILALGGSTTQGTQQDARYPSILQTLLSAAYPQADIEVFNAGRDWATTRHSLIAYTTYYEDWKPDIVLILEGINDLYRSFSPMPYAIGDYDPLYSHFYGASANGAKPPTFEQHLFGYVAGPIVTVQWYEAPFVRKRQVDYPLSVYRSLHPYASNLHKLITAVRTSGAEPVLITQASLFKAEMSDEERKALWFGETFCATRTGFARYEYPTMPSLKRALDSFNDTTKSIAALEHVTVVDGDAAVSKSLDSFEDDCHYTGNGARQLATAVADVLKESGLLETRQTLAR